MEEMEESVGGGEHWSFELDPKVRSWLEAVRRRVWAWPRAAATMPVVGDGGS